MATIVDIEAALQTDYTVDTGSPQKIRIQQSFIQDATYTNYFVSSTVDNLVNKGSWLRATTANSAGDQADEIRAALAQHAPTVNVGP